MKKFFEQLWNDVQYVYYAVATWFVKQKCKRMTGKIKDMQSAMDWWKETEEKKTR